MEESMDERSWREREEACARWLEGWFDRMDGLSRWSVYKSAVWGVLRRRLKGWGRWKDRPRCDPKKGRAVQKGVVGW